MRALLLKATVLIFGPGLFIISSYSWLESKMMMLLLSLTRDLTAVMLNSVCMV
jgi:hypothetical protein